MFTFLSCITRGLGLHSALNAAARDIHKSRVEQKTRVGTAQEITTQENAKFRGRKIKGNA